MVAAIITARMKSSRIFQKVLAPICGRPVLDWIADRLRGVDKIVLATPGDEYEKPLWDWAFSRNVSVAIGDKDDVLLRLSQAAQMYGADKIIRITGDLPFLSKEGIQAIIKALDESVDYVNNIYGDRPWLDGTSAEAAWTDAVLRANRFTPFGPGKQIRPKIQVDGTWRLHGLHWMANCPDFRCAFVDHEEDVSGLPHLLVDEPNDLKVAEFVMEKVLKSDDSYSTLLKIVRENKEQIERIRRDS